MQNPLKSKYENDIKFWEHLQYRCKNIMRQKKREVFGKGGGRGVVSTPLTNGR